MDWKPATSRYKVWLAIIGLVLSFALLDGIHTHLGAIAEGSRPLWTTTLYQTAIFWLIYAAFIPPVLFVANKYQLDLRRRKAVVIHLAAALAFTYVHILAGMYLMAPFRTTQLDFMPLLGRLVRLNFGIDFLTYWAIVGATYALRYHGESRERELAAAQLQARLTESRLEALRAQLNPHFLFNTLNAVSVLALKGQQNAVLDTLSRLSDLLRVSLDDKRPQKVPLAEEIEFLDRYLDILRLRFGDRMIVERHVAPETLNALVPCMILQPLVENAVVHGISAQCGEGRIAIKSERVNGFLHLEVSDTGPGFGSGASRGHGIGLGNTRARLEQIYGAAHCIDLRDSAGGGAMVSISLPFVAADERSAAGPTS
jgi:two-component sensor histidine kinase